ncbi:type 1 fimbrial major subunit FimA [Rosenbergiella nectarea]|uniref:type 1 fimbrial major subunit FimA n=1 Tax=Rosenbergiella nectarea TaxID=988801 RepID=UPI001BDA6599|nr:type 1 fimbrial major subunit FimA [Rosenbergiella nectarea]MBT0728584.1 type 1 fimbrial protein subunit FimA [Rosenbergiella nectarea subsp. apis]
MKMKTLALASIAAFGLVSVAAQAADATPVTVNGGTVHFTGEFVNAACAVSTDTADQTVNLGQYTTSQLTAVGQRTTAKPFNIKLVNCSTATYKTASISFKGTIDATDKTLLAVNGGGSNATAATGVGIEILDASSTPLTPNGTSYSTAQTLITGTNTLPFTARYKSTLASVSAGTADADATFVVQYQ